MADIIDETFRLIQRLFRHVRIPYAIIGGYAAGVWGVERATLDIDVLVGGRSRCRATTETRRCESAGRK